MSRLTSWVACGALVASISAPASARELWSHGDIVLEHRGSLREIVSTAEQTDQDDLARGLATDLRGCVVRDDIADCPAFSVLGDERVVQSFTRLRNRFHLRLHEAVSAVVVYDHEVQAGDIDTLESSLSNSLSDDTFLGAEGDILDRESVEWRHLLYRGYLELATDRVDLTIGRQRVPWGVGRLWQPIDRFSAIPPLAVQGDESPGVDGIDARWIFDGFHYLQAVYAPGTSRDEAKMALRFHGVFYDTDYSIMGGRFERAPTAGFDLSRNVGPAAVGLEVVYTNPEREIWPVGAPGPREPGEYWQVVASVDGNLDWGQGIYWLVEHLYNGNALGFGEGRAGGLLPFLRATDDPFLPIAPETSAVFAGSRVVTGARHQTGFEIGTDVTPEVRADLLTIADWNGASVVFFPTLRYSPADFIDLTIGVQASAGRRLSQYGGAGELAYLLIDLYF